MKKNILTLRPPLAGISRQNTYQTQPPFSSFDSLNYWPLDTKTGRQASAIRPARTSFGTLKQQVTMLSQVNGIAPGLPQQSFAAAYDGTLFYWNGSTLITAGGTRAADIDTNRYVSATPFVNQLFMTKVGEAPFVFDYPTQTVEPLIASAGVVPVGAHIVVNWMGAIWLAVDSILHASRVGVPTDWDVSVPVEDLFGAFFTDAQFRGILSGPITAVMPQVSDTMLVSTLTGTLAMRGHPRQGGVFEAIGSSYALGQGAWCLAPGDTLFMLTPLGIMSVAPTPGATMIPVSRERIPDELIGLLFDPAESLVNMLYDTRWNGIHIYVRGLQEQAWWFDLSTGGFHRMETASYPFTITEFQPFVTESTSAVLTGSYDGIHQFDRFGVEDINGALIVGPAKISQSPESASKIISARVTFARNTPLATGTLQIATGLDGQDAINRLLQGLHQYEVPLSTLNANNGICYPQVTGHAVAIAFSTEAGDIAFEEINLDLVPVGRPPYGRTTQIAVEGQQTEFAGAFIDLDPTAWTGFVPVIPSVAPATTLPDYTHFLDLSLMPQEWWDQTRQTDGSDIRVSNPINESIPTLVVDFDQNTQAGMLMFRMNQTTTPQGVRVWIGNPSADVPPSDSTNGSDNVFDTFWRGFWYNGGQDSNVTQYAAADGLAITNRQNGVVDGLVYGNVPGPLGARATDFYVGQSNDLGTFWSIANWAANQGLSSANDWTLIAVANLDILGSTSTTRLLKVGAGVFGDGIQVGRSGVTNPTTEGASGAGGGFTVISTTATPVIPTVPDQWHHHAFTQSIPDHTVYIDGGNSTTNALANAATLDYLLVGKPFGLSNANDRSWEGDMALLQVHTIARNADWIAYQASMMLDQVNFWGSIGDFNLVNVIPEPELNTAVCPVGPEPVVETGNWSGYAQALPTNPVGGSVSDFSHMIDLAAMPAAWWLAVSATGVDVRVTDVANTLLPFDLVEFDSVGETGLLVYRATQVLGGPAAVRIWVGNPAAVTVPVCGTYGQYNAYDSGFRGFWPSGAGNDRTQWVNHLTATGNPASNPLGSPVGSEETFYSNSGSTGQYSSGGNILPVIGPYSVTASARLQGTLFEDSVLAGVESSTSRSSMLLHTRPSAEPARLTTRNSFGSEASAGSSTVINPATQWNQSGLSFGNFTRIVNVNGGGTSFNPQSTVVLSDLDRVVIGAEVGDNPSRGFTGHISLVSVHSVARGTAWFSYWDASHDQSTFWGAWAFTNDTQALGQ